MLTDYAYAALSKTPHALADGLMLVFQHPGSALRAGKAFLFLLSATSGMIQRRRRWVLDSQALSTYCIN